MDFSVLLSLLYDRKDLILQIYFELFNHFDNKFFQATFLPSNYFIFYKLINFIYELNFIFRKYYTQFFL